MVDVSGVFCIRIVQSFMTSDEEISQSYEYRNKCNKYCLDSYGFGNLQSTNSLYVIVDLSVSS